MIYSSINQRFMLVWLRIVQNGPAIVAIRLNLVGSSLFTLVNQNK